MANAKKWCQETVNAERRSWILVSELPLGTQGPIVLFSKNRDECHGHKDHSPRVCAGKMAWPIIRAHSTPSFTSVGFDAWKLSSSIITTENSAT
jgi:hypothetical protein